MAKKILEFKTSCRVEDGRAVTVCGPLKNNSGLKHRFAEERNKTGHYPGFVYLLKLENDRLDGNHYKIGKCENTEIETDDFDLDEIHNQMLERLRMRLLAMQKNKRQPEYRNFKFVHAIRVACGEGAKKHPFELYSDSLAKILGADEVYKLSEEDIEIFKNARGEMLGYPIKHLFAEDFKVFLNSVDDKKIRVE